MEWDLGLPLLVILATGVVMALIYISGRSLIFKPRQKEGYDAVADDDPGSQDAAPRH